MPRLIAILSLCLLMWAEPASAQRSKTYKLTVGRHADVVLRAAQVDEIFVEASSILRQCNVTLTRKDPVRTFASPDTPAVIETVANRDAVHAENFDIKVVTDINFCRVHGDHSGCAWDPSLGDRDHPQRRSMIVKLQATTKASGQLWAHEFGHRTGLWHRASNTALMTPCPLESRHVRITRNECECFFGGPGFCSDPEPDPAAQCEPRRQ